jgi:diguanylate cyclase (GGDEF)-like protein
MTSDHTTSAVEAPGEAASASNRSEGHTALIRTMALAGGLGATAVVLIATDIRFMTAPNPGWLPWWLLAILFALAEVLVFHIEVRRDAITFSLSELPLTLALLFASPIALLVGRLIGEAAILTLRERQQPRKILTNLAVFLAETTTALVVFHALPGSHDIHSAGTWVAAVIAVAAADALSLSAIITVMRWHGAPVEPKQFLLTNGITAVTNTTLAVMAAMLLDTNPASVGLLLVLTAIVVIAYRGYSALSRRHSSLALLYDFTRMVSGSNSPDEVLASMLKETKRLLRADSAAIVCVGDTNPISLWLGLDGDVAHQRVLPVDRLRQLVSAGGAVVIDRNDRDLERCAIVEMLGVTDCIVAPLVDATGPIGVLLVADRETAVSTFDADDGRVFETLAIHAGMALENERLIDRLHEHAQQREYQALHDPLTELPNRANFLQRLSETITNAHARTHVLGVGLLDLDHFKEVNDTLGHHHGDLLLREVAIRLRAALPPTITLARLGGDEFAVFTQCDTSAAELMALGNTIQRSFTDPFAVDGFGLEIGVSTGFALFPDHGADPSTLLQRADVAMYDAKASSTNHIEIYDPTRDANSPRRLSLATDLRTAIEAHELVLHYQPKARMSDRRVHGVEGLVRWRHPLYGSVPPDDFVPLAERTGLIHPFTNFVLGQGVEQLRDWTDVGLDLGVSLNLSMRNLQDRSLPAHVEAVIALAGVDPRKVTFEVTETSMMAEPDKVLRVLQALADLGVRLSVDDFGTGHSSLAYLQRLPVHEVKIDKSFILPMCTDRDARAIVQSIIQLAHNLELNVVAEGIEDERTWNELLHLGCDDGQGYYLSRPASAVDLVTWLDTAKWASPYVAFSASANGLHDGLELAERVSGVRRGGRLAR